MEGHHHQDPPQGVGELDLRHAPPHPRRRHLPVSPHLPTSPASYDPVALRHADVSGRADLGLRYLLDPIRDSVGCSDLIRAQSLSQI